MYGTDNKLLSGIPIHQIGTIKKGDTNKAQTTKKSYTTNQPLELMPLGQYKGTAFNEIPSEYKQWILKEFSWNPANQNHKQTLEASL